MPKDNVMGPTEGFPCTRVVKDDDNQIIGYDIFARYLTPMGARTSDKLSVLTGVSVLYGYFQLYDRFELPWYVTALACLILPIATAWVTRHIFYQFFKRRRLIKFRADRFEVCGLFRAKAYDRNVQHSYATYEHDWSETEDRICSALEQLLPRLLTIKPFKRYIGKSRCIAYEYLGQRQDLMLVYKPKTAREILARLNACDKLMDGAAGNGRGEVLEPQAEWSDHGGSIVDANI